MKKIILQAEKSGPESEDYIDYLNSKEITENIIENEVVDYRLADDGLYIDTFETYLIFYEDQSTVKKSFNSTYFWLIMRGYRSSMN